MEGLEKLLVAVDLGAKGTKVTMGSRRALDLALDIAPSLGAHVTILHSSAADEHWEADEEGHIFSADGLDNEGIGLLESIVEEFRNVDVPVELLIVEERPFIGIIRNVMEHDIDMVIVGKRSAHDGEGDPLGSVSSKLIRKCPCLVWAVVPGEAHHPENILAAADMGPMGARVLHTALQLRRVWDTDLHVFHAFQLTMEQHRTGVSEDELRDIAEARRAELAGHFDEETGTIHAALTSPTRGIMESVRRFHPGLVVLGTVGRGGIPGLLLGSTADRLLRSLQCSVLVVKPADFECPIKLT